MIIQSPYQMLGCGAHVRKIALPHVRCACGSACGKGLKLCVRCACVQLNFGRAMCDRTFAHFLEQNDQIMVQMLSFCSLKCAKVRSHIAHPKMSHTHAHRTHSFKPFPHALPHAHRTCESALIRTCAPQPNICFFKTFSKQL